MQLFSDQLLRDNPHIAVLGSSKLGNFVVTTPLLRGVKQEPVEFQDSIRRPPPCCGG